MVIVDAQVHVWSADPPERASPAHRSPPRTDELVAAMREAGVARAVLVPPSWDGDRNDTALAAASHHPDRFAVMGRFPLDSPVSAESLRRWRERTGVLGVRITLHRDPWLTWFLAGDLHWVWHAAEMAGMPVMVYAPNMAEQFGPIARAHPGLRLIMDHLALPENHLGDPAFTALADLTALARFPNVAVKASALPCHSLSPYPFPDLHRHIRKVFDSFGPQRMFWGSDYTRLPCTYRQSVTHFTEELGFVSADDLTWIMGRALLEWINWPR